MHDLYQNDLKQLVENIRSLLPIVQSLRSQCEQDLSKIEDEKRFEDLRTSEDYWQARFQLDAMRRIGLFIEQNFTYIEPMGLLAVTRYMFELTVWHKLMSADKRDARIYHHEVIVGQQNYYKDQKDHLEKEMAFLDDYGKLEDDLFELALESKTRSDPTAVASIMTDIDEEVSRKFSIYGENARTNGYCFQAYLIQTKVLPQIQQRIDELKIEMDWYKAEIPDDIATRVRKRWNWKDEAKKVAMTSEYDFIYCYTSKLIHATPFSLSTNQQNLDVTEMRLFLKYIYIRMQDIIRSISKRTV